MNDFLPQAVAKVYNSPNGAPVFGNTENNENNLQVQGNVIQLIGDLLDEIRETAEARRKVIREIIEDTMNFRINLFEKLALHFSREAMLEERKRATILALFDRFTFYKPPNIRW